MAAIRWFVFVLLAIAGTASPALAGSVKVGGGPFQAGVGGEFTLTNQGSGGLDLSNYDPKASLTANSFQTFCLEYSEHISFGGVYDVALNTKAISGGGGAIAGADPISKGTAWLYSQFANGTLAGYDYGPLYGGSNAGRNQTAALLQQAIWGLESEPDAVTYWNPANPFLIAVLTKFGSAANAKADADSSNNYFGVRVLNLTVNGVKAQDQLFYVPDGGSTAMLLGCALAGLGVLRRRFGAQ